MHPGTEKISMQQPPPYPGCPPVYAYQQHQPIYVPPMQSHGPTVVQTTVVPTVAPVIIARHMGSKPAHITCRSCNVAIVTRVEMQAATRTHLFAAFLCLLGFWPCACIPYCIDSCNNVNHYCPNCSSYIGSYVC